jgi:hypothetical protein
MTRRTASPRLGAWLLAVLLVAGPGARDARAEDTVARAVLTTASTTVPPVTAFSVDVVVRSERPVQAFDLVVTWDGARLRGMDVAPHPEFDDDARLLLQPLRRSGTFSRIVDVRHGGQGASGTFGLVTLHFFSGPTPGPTSISIERLALGSSGGGEFDEIQTLPLEIHIEP